MTWLVDIWCESHCLLWQVTYECFKFFFMSLSHSRVAAPSDCVKRHCIVRSLPQPKTKRQTLELYRNRFTGTWPQTATLFQNISCLLQVLVSIRFFFYPHECPQPRNHHKGRVKGILYLSPMRAAKVQASLRIRAGSPEPSLLAHTSSEKRDIQTESQIPGPSEWPCMRSWNLSWRNARRHKFAWRGLHLRCCNSASIFNWTASSEFVSSSIPSWQILTAHAKPFRRARDLAFCLKVPLDSLLVWASSGGSGETVRMHRGTFAARIDDNYQIRLTRSNLEKLYKHT